ncbi:MAG: hypothetical protein JWM16_2398 [Verrucomicrobiales bacterium]|nr:hypothetical protein [Verrucomicrobiales bacterium]
MHKNNDIPNWAWELYQAKQEEALNCPNDATEETLNYLERLFTTGNIPATKSILEQMVDNRLAGHRQKVRRRIHLVENNSDLLVPSQNPATETTDCLNLIKGNVTASQWRLLTGLAQGDSYRRLSTACGLSVASAKSNVCRIRKKLRAFAFAE